jgi:hypothetical protein
MKQILHIFAKDAHHQWLEILISLAFVATLVFTYRSHGTIAMYGVVSYSPLGMVSHMPDWLVFIIPLSWWLLISPLVHEEKLVGHRQFWITRPYEWKKLLAAKVLFLVVFLYLPLLLAQCFILVRAGFSPFPYLSGLVYDLCLLTCALVLPLVTLAVVTRNFARMTLAVLGALACLFVIFLLSSNESPDRVAVPYGETIPIVLLLSLCVAVVLLQYARRRTKVSWLLLGVLVVMFGAFNRGGAPDDAQMNRKYPGRIPAAAQFAYHDAPETQPTAFVADKYDRVGLSIPVQVSGVADGTVVSPDFLKATIQAPDGSRWTSVWRPIFMDKFFPEPRIAKADFTMPRAIYDSFQGKSLNVQVTFALTQAHATGTQQIALRSDDFAVSGFGICSGAFGDLEHPDEMHGLVCRAPLHQPDLTLIHAAWSNTPCNAQPGSTPATIQTASWTGAVDHEPADFGIVPMWSSQIDFTNQYEIEKNRVVGFRTLCAGTPVTFIRYELMRRGQAGFAISDFQLPHLVRGEVRAVFH